MKKETKIPEAGSQQPKNKFVVFAQSIWSRIIPSFNKEVISNQLNAKQPLIILINSQNLRVDESDPNLFYDLGNEKFSIRVIKQKDKDQCVFATSVLHEFEEVDASLMKNAIPQLVKVQISNTHELLITKSPAAKFSDIGENALNFIFSHISDVDNWTKEKVVFIVTRTCNCLDFSSVVPICKFKGLNKKLSLIEGLNIRESGEPFGFENSLFSGLRYSFTLFMGGSSFLWKDLKPEIEQVFRDYFKENVEFEYRQ